MTVRHWIHVYYPSAFHYDEYKSTVLQEGEGYSLESHHLTLLSSEFPFKLEKASILVVLDTIGQNRTRIQKPITNRFREPKVVAVKSVLMRYIVDVDVWVAIKFRNLLMHKFLPLSVAFNDKQDSFLAYTVPLGSVRIRYCSGRF